MNRNTTTEEQPDLGHINWAECPHVKRDPAMMSGARGAWEEQDYHCRSSSQISPRE